MLEHITPVLLTYNEEQNIAGRCRGSVGPRTLSLSTAAVRMGRWWYWQAS